MKLIYIRMKSNLQMKTKRSVDIQDDLAMNGFDIYLYIQNMNKKIVSFAEKVKGTYPTS